MRAAVAVLLTVLAGCSLVRSAEPPLPSLVGSEWVAEDLGGRGVHDRIQSTLRFDSTTRVSGSGGCNRYTGALAEVDGTLHIGQLASTRMACPPALLDQETRFLIALAKTARLERRDDTLTLFGADGARLATLTLLTPAP